VQRAAVAHQRAARRIGDEVSERVDPVLARSGAAIGDGVTVAAAG